MSFFRLKPSSDSVAIPGEHSEDYYSTGGVVIVEGEDSMIGPDGHEPVAPKTDATMTDLETSPIDSLDDRSLSVDDLSVEVLIELPDVPRSEPTLISEWDKKSLMVTQSNHCEGALATKNEVSAHSVDQDFDLRTFEKIMQPLEASRAQSLEMQFDEQFDKHSEILDYILLSVWSGLINLLVFVTGSAHFSWSLAQGVRNIFATMWYFGGWFYRKTKVIIRRNMSDDAPNEVVAFLAGVVVTIFFVIAFLLLQCGTISVLCIAQANITAALEPILLTRKAICDTLRGEVTVVEEVPNITVLPEPKHVENINTLSSVPNASIAVESLFESPAHVIDFESALNRLFHPCAHSLWVVAFLIISRVVAARKSSTIAKAIVKKEEKEDKAPAVNTQSLYRLRVNKKGGSILKRHLAILESKTLVDLKAECRKAKLIPVGNKDDLIVRLCQHYVSQEIESSRKGTKEQMLAENLFQERDVSKYEQYNQAELQALLRKVNARYGGLREDLIYRLLLTYESKYLVQSNRQLTNLLQKHNLSTEGGKAEWARRLAEANVWTF
jgi:hypothetical protein